MKKFVLIIVAGLMISACADKKSPEATAEPAAATTAVTPEQLEGKIVSSTNGGWYVVKDGQRWRTMSEASSSDYIKSISGGDKDVVTNVPEETLMQFPIVGEIMPNVQYKKD